MNKSLKIILYLAIAAFTIAWTIPFSDSADSKISDAYRDLNKNGKMDVYEDKSKSTEARVNDLLSQMTLEEKAGLMFINGVRLTQQGFGGSATEFLNDKKMNHFNIWGIPPIKEFVTWHNETQKSAENTRLGIPVTIASDPRNAFSNSIFSTSANQFSQWPEQLGFAAIGDEKLMKQHAEMARQEYLAVGIREALHPMADLATEPRWARVSGTFGEDAHLSAKLINAYILGFQGEKLGPNSVACMTKHFSGGGPQKEGLDPHFEFQKGQVYPGDNFEYHLIPFEAAFAANTAAIMPYYGIPTGQTSEDVAFGFNKDIITGLLRNKYKYNGIVCTDWGLITDTKMGPVVWPARAWGVEQLSEEDRVLKAINAGVDQFGGENCPEHVVSLVKKGKLTEERINESVHRLLTQKFVLGLFDNPYVDEEKALKTVGKEEFKKAGEAAQRRSFTLLKNEKKTLPLKSNKLKIYIKNVNPKTASKYGTIVDSPEKADIAVVRLNTPWYPVETENRFAQSFHHGDLDFKGARKDSILQILNAVPTIVDLYLDRPAVIPEIAEKSKALLANYGASDEALFDVIFGKAKPGGKLPFELPSSMEAVEKQKEDVPYDSENPLYKFGFGLSY